MISQSYNSNRGRPDYLLSLSIILLVVIGLIVLSSASVIVSQEKFGTSYYFFTSQLLGVILGGFTFFFLSRFPYIKLAYFAVPGMVLTILLLILVFMPGIGLKYGGASRWIAVGGKTIQPTEFAKLATILYLAVWLNKKGPGISDVRYGLGSFLTIIGVVAFLIIMQPDIGTLFVIIASAIAMFFAAGARYTHVLGIIFGGLFLLSLLIMSAGYRRDRFTAFLNPDIDPSGIGYQINQSLIAIGSGGWIGVGLGHSRQKHSFLPEAPGDAIFAVMAEELGFIRVSLVLLLYLFIIYRGFRIAMMSKGGFGKLLATGITMWIGLQALVNMGALVGLIPMTGIPLPLVSFGSSAVLATLSGAGILVNISRYIQD